MRMIKFRGKRLDGQGWVYGVPQVTGISGVYMVWSKTVTSQRRDGSMSVYDKVEQAEVLPESVGQWTGLVDKNGKEIYEGDIVTTDITRPYLIVEFRNGCFVFNCNDGGEDYYDIMLPITENPHDTYKFGEIIGNIHDNPELMEME